MVLNKEACPPRISESDTRLFNLIIATPKSLSATPQLSDTPFIIRLDLELTVQLYLEVG